jgi:hypothetical protein
MPRAKPSLATLKRLRRQSSQSSHISDSSSTLRETPMPAGTTTPARPKRPGRRPSRSSHNGNGSDTPRDLVPLDSGPDAASEPCPLGDVVADGSPQPAANLSPVVKSGSDRLKELAKQIRPHYRRMLHAATIAVEEHILIGQFLIEAKSLCKHGQFGRFLTKCKLNQSTANQCMQFAQSRALIERNSYGRTNLTVDAVRKMIAAERKASGQSPKRRSARATSPDRTGEGEGTGAASTTGSTVGEPAAGAADPAAEASAVATEPPTATEPTTKAQCGGDLVDPIEPAKAASGTGADPAEPGGGPARQGTPDPDEPSDAEWLASIPLRADLEPEARKNFDQEALLWRRTQPAREQVRAAINPSRKDIKDSRFFKMALNRLPLRLLWGVSVKDPHEWTICPNCRGRFTAKVGLICGLCDGQSYRLTHEGDEQQSEEEE